MNYIKLMRSLKDKSYYSKDSEKLHLWIHLLLTANWSDREELLGGKPIKCKAGQFTTGRKQLSRETGISESKIERLLTYFEKIEQQIEQQKTSTNRLISILNWDKYQVSEQQSGQRANNDRTTSEQRVDTPKEEEEIKEVKELKQKPKKKDFDFSFVSEEFYSAFMKWINYKNEIKQSYKTQTSIQTCYDNLLNLSENDNVLAMDIVNQSIGNGWAGLFTLKNKKGKDVKIPFPKKSNTNTDDYEDA